MKNFFDLRPFKVTDIDVVIHVNKKDAVKFLAELYGYGDLNQFLKENDISSEYSEVEELDLDSGSVFDVESKNQNLRMTYRQWLKIHGNEPVHFSSEY